MRNFYFILLLLIAFQSSATHIVGGEINYVDLGGYNYEITLTVYRDCLNGLAQFDEPAAIGIFDQFNNLIYNEQVYYNDSEMVPPAYTAPCLIPPTNICYDMAHYITDVYLPPIPGGYQIVYERCCRNGTIINIQNPLAAGATYYATIPDTGLAAVNSNPVFKNRPPTFICVGEPFTFDHSATDADGDSLVYTLCDPINGPPSLSQTTPQPNPPFDPPFNTVSWQAPYSASNEFGGVPLVIDPVTGILTCTPNTLGQFVYGVCVQEYRNGIYLGETHRDFQVNMVNCPKVTVTTVANSISECGSLTANFIANGSNIGSYHWDFGDSTSVNDTSNLANPSYTYPDTGTYNVTLIAYSSYNDSCNATAITTVTLYPPLHPNFTYTYPPCTDSVFFADSSIPYNDTITSWGWNFGDGSADTTENPLHIYSSVGTFPVTFVIKSLHGCVDTLMKSVDLTNFSADFICVTGCTDSAFFMDSLNLFKDTVNTLTWNFGDSSTSTGPDPLHIYNEPGQYSVSLIITTDRGCVDTVTKTIAISNFKADFTYLDFPCNDSVYFTDNSLQIGDTANQWNWNFGDGGSSTNTDPIYVYNTGGNFTIKLIASTKKGCTDTVTKTIDLSKFKADFNYYVGCNDSAFFKDTLSFINDSLKALKWNFGDNSTSTAANVYHIYNNPVNYSVSLMITTGNGCIDTVTKTIAVTGLKTDFNYTTVPCNDSVSFQDNTVQNGDPVKSWNWDFGNSGNSTGVNPIHVFHGAGNFSVTLITTTQKGCTDSVTKAISIAGASKADFSTLTMPCRPEVQFNNSSINALSYNWNFGDGTSSNEPNPMHVYNEQGTYHVTLYINEGTFCIDSMTNVLDYASAEMLAHFLPNAFTPNNDGLNDKFIVTGDNPCEVVELIVYNRWGQIIYDTKDISSGWDGTLSGTVVAEGVYVYILKGEGWSRYGTVTVIK